MTTATTADPLKVLREPFPPDVIKWRPGAATKDKTKAVALGYVDARDVMERFDAAFGPASWSDRYTVLPDGAVEATISVTLEAPYSTSKSDVGYSNDPGTDKETEPLKAAYSDAFKRAGVKWGVGRDLYDLPQLWLPLNQYGRFDAVPQFVNGQWVDPSRASSVAHKPAGATETTDTSKDVSQEVISDGQRRKILAKCQAIGLTEPQVKAAWALLFQKKSVKDLTVAEFQTALVKLDDTKFVESLREVEKVG